jgi:peptide/nickel transport system ATP-binding protein
LIEADPAHWPRRAEAGIGEVVLSAHGIAKDYGRGPLFDGLDVTLARGERLVLQGPSGAGKSTLGNVLLGLVPADRGRVERGAGLQPFAMQKLYQDPVGSFPAHAALGDVLRDVATLHARPWPAMARRLEELRVPGELLERRPAQVSGGELQRVALARVLAVDPAVIVADEPTSRLDPLSQRDAIHVLLSAAEASQAALVLVTHDADIARALATRTLVFDDGGLVWAGGAQRSSEGVAIR